MKNLSLGLKIGVVFLISGVIGTSAIAEVIKKQSITTTKTITGQGTKSMTGQASDRAMGDDPWVAVSGKAVPKKFDDPLFKKKDLKRPIANPKKFEDPMFKKKYIKKPVVDQRREQFNLIR